MVYPAMEAMAERIHNFVLLNTEPEPLGCRSVFQPAGCQAQNRHLQKLYQPSTNVLGTGVQSTSRNCNNESRNPNGVTGLPNGGRPVEPEFFTSIFTVEGTKVPTPTPKT